MTYSKWFKTHKEEIPTYRGGQWKVPAALGATHSVGVSSMFILGESRRSVTHVLNALRDEELDPSNRVLAKDSSIRFFAGGYEKMKGSSQYKYDPLSYRQGGGTGMRPGGSLGGGMSHGRKTDATIDTLSTITDVIEDPIEGASGWAIGKMLEASGLKQNFFFVIFAPGEQGKFFDYQLKTYGGNVIANPGDHFQPGRVAIAQLSQIKMGGSLLKKPTTKTLANGMTLNYAGKMVPLKKKKKKRKGIARILFPSPK